MANGVRTRKDVWKLADWDPILEWYAKAIGEMQRRPLADPTSWRYQAAIHDYDPSGDPFASPEDTPPSATDQQRFWRQCQHNTWFFLPWHRIYLGYFEQIVASTVARLGGPADWALPYWNYSDPRNENARRLPPAFRALKTPEGLDNPLRVEARGPGCNAGDIIADDTDVDLSASLTEPLFSGGSGGGNPGFGGPQTLFNHSGGAVGTLELAPHASMHVAVGRWMGRFNTAALDPIFWLHHANIDRLWAVWRGRNAVHLDPTEVQWLTTISFAFHDTTGKVVTVTPAQVVDTTEPPWGYRYEDITDPLEGTLEAVAAGSRRPSMKRRPISEMVGATDKPTILRGQPETAHLAVTAPTGPARTALEAAESPPEIYLNLENITGSGDPTSYEVYLNLPPGADPHQHKDLLAGVLPMFGVAEATRGDREHSGSGVHYALKVSDVVRRLQSRNAWDPNDLRVTFIPRRSSAGMEAAPEPIHVGRIGLYYE